MLLEYPKARERLERMIEDLSTRDARIRSDLARAAGPLSPDFAEQAVESRNDTVLQRIDEAAVRDLAQARHALERLHAGVYSLCERCGFQIEAARLEHLPHATLCSECADLNSR